MPNLGLCFPPYPPSKPRSFSPFFIIKISPQERIWHESLASQLLMSLHHLFACQGDFTFQAFYVTIERMALFGVKGSVRWWGRRLCGARALSWDSWNPSHEIAHSFFSASQFVVKSRALFHQSWGTDTPTSPLQLSSLPSLPNHLPGCVVLFWISIIILLVAVILRKRQIGERGVFVDYLLLFKLNVYRLITLKSIPPGMYQVPGGPIR